LGSSLTADLVVVGSGIAGLSTAYEAALKGASVIVLDRGPIARGISARTSAHLTSALDDFYHEFIPLRGEKAAKQHFASQAAAIERIDEIRRSERIACDFKRLPAYLFLAGQTEPQALEDERKALGIVGLRGARVEAAPAIEHKLSDGPCLIIPDQGRFHPLKYLDGVARACVRRGVRLFGGTCVTSMGESRDGAWVETREGHKVTSDAVVVATNTPINDRITIHAKQAPYRTYVLGAAVPKGLIRDVLYWDTEEPYHYVRLHPAADGQMLLVGGEDHKSGTADNAKMRLRRLERWARQRFPEMGEVVYRWSGQVMDTIDFAAFIGVNPGNRRIFVATGDSGQGITHGVVAGMMLPGLIATGRHRWSSIYDPARKPLKTAGKMFSQGVDVFKNLAERVLPGEITSNRIHRGSGGIKRAGLHLVAVCRDEEGALHEHRASCTHAGCTVHWNTFEQCWDCPCHGSHFAADGTALNAPAIESLAPAADRGGNAPQRKARRPPKTR
jgi:glycine/D-amino acid oxidase-like deaminating enzyme/nitrite reductase/ring-hydroxylating ferredoxin subunit